MEAGMDQEHARGHDAGNVSEGTEEQVAVA